MPGDTAPGSSARRYIVAALFVALIGIGIALFADHEPPPNDPALDRELPPVVDYPVAPGTPVRCWFVLGDTGTGDRGQFEVVDAMSLALASGGPIDGILLLGDNFYPDGVRTPTERQWDDKIVEPYARFGVPIHACLGNHDYGGRIEAQIERSTIDERWHMPQRHYSFETPIGPLRSIQFIALDTEPMRDRDEPDNEQLAWLDAELARSKAHWKIVFGHHPAYSGGEKGDSGRMLDRLVPILDRHDVDIYFAAHHHTLQFFGPLEGVRYVVSGAGSGSDEPDEVEWHEKASYAATGGGFVALRLTDQEAVIEFVRTDGKKQYSTRWLKP